MCTYSQLKKLCVTPQGVNGAPYVPKLYVSSGIDISKCIEGRSMKLTTLVDYIYICSGSRMHFRVTNVFFIIDLFVIFFKTIYFFYLVKATPIREPIKLHI